MKKTLQHQLLIVVLILLAFTNCKKSDIDNLNDYPPPSAQEKEDWLGRMNEEISSLKNIVNAIMEEDYVTSIVIDSNKYVFKFLNTPDVSFQLDNASYPAPLIGAHKIDDNYFWTRISGTGTSATVLLKDANRSNYEIEKDGITPSLGISDNGDWILNVDNQVQELYDSEGKKFRAIGVKALFDNVTFDIDSNATIITNEVPAREYVIPKYRPFTLLLSLPSTDQLMVPSGFSMPIDFQSSGIESMEFVTPKEWSASYQFAEDKKSGLITITAPTGMEADFDEEGVLEVIAINQYGDRLIRKINVKCEVGLVNYASVNLTNVPTGIDITGAVFTFSESSSSVNTKEVTAIKAGEFLRLMLPDGFPELRKATFAVAGSNSFDYYFAPETTLSIGDQQLSIAPPEVLSFWQGGIILKINETQQLTGINKYKITGKIMHLKIGPKVPWFPNGNVNVTAADSETDGSTNTKEIIKALGGNGASANYIARWPVRITDGGYVDWYLGAVQDYQIFHVLRTQNKTVFDQAIAEYGGVVLNETINTTFWTSTNINQTQARMYDHRKSEYISPGTKVYGCYGLAFRDIQ